MKGVCTGLGRRYCIVQERSVTFRYHILLIDSISDQITTTDWENSLLPFFSGCPFSTNCRISNNLRRRRRWRRRDRKKSTAETTSGFRKKSHVQPTDSSTDLTSPLYPPSSADFDMVTTFHQWEANIFICECIYKCLKIQLGGRDRGATSFNNPQRAREDGRWPRPNDNINRQIFQPHCCHGVTIGSKCQQPSDRNWSNPELGRNFHFQCFSCVRNIISLVCHYICSQLNY